MEEPSTIRFVRVSVTLDAALLRAIDALVKDEQRNRSKLLADAAAEAVRTGGTVRPAAV